MPNGRGWGEAKSSFQRSLEIFSRITLEFESKGVFATLVLKGLGTIHVRDPVEQCFSIVIN